MIDDFGQELQQVNQYFATVNLGLQIEQRGQKLVLRGILPPKPDQKRLYPHQQRLSLGLKANLTELKQAEQQAKIIAAQLIQNTFQWQNYLEGRDPLRGSESLSDRLAAFEQHFWRTRGESAATRTTWKTAYAPYLKKLVAIAQQQTHLSEVELIYQTVLSTQPNSRSRQICCTALKVFSEFLELTLPFEWSSLWGNYNYSHLKERQLPDDQTIVNWYAQIPSPEWRFVYGIMATFGLRNHEVFFCDYTHLQNQTGKTVQVLEMTKTGRHEVWAFPPDWIDIFNLSTANLPILNTDLNQTTLQNIGQRITQRFKRYNIPFTPYDLRHAWAVRAIHYGIPDAIAAQMMGHSIAVHTRTYQRWITRRDQQQAVDAALQRMERR